MFATGHLAAVAGGLYSFSGTVRMTEGGVSFVFNTGPSMMAFLKKYWWVLSFTLLLWLSACYFVIRGNQAAFEAIFRAQVAGEIQSLESTNKGFAVRVTLTDRHRYRFFPVDRGERGFMAVTAVGDSLRKRSFSDTLFLVHKGGVVRYAFKKVVY
jgi:hypothetical protein